MSTPKIKRNSKIKPLVLVSIIIPTFNRIELCRRAISSVLSQDYLKFECFIVNDNPLDKNELELIVINLADKRINLINHTKTKGGNAARNTGIRESVGDVIFFLDDDDWWVDSKISTHVNFHTSNTKYGLVYSNFIKIWQGHKRAEKIGSPRVVSNVELAMTEGVFCPATTSAVSVKRICFEELGYFDEKIVSYQDWDMWYRISKRYEFGYIDQMLVYFYQHSGLRTSTNISKRVMGLNQIVNKWDGQLSKNFIKKYSKQILKQIMFDLFKHLKNGHVKPILSLFNELIKWGTMKNCMRLFAKSI